MSIQLFNTLSGKIETFKPLLKGEVGFYACGPTVYDYAHIGNFRAFVFEDILRRFLEVKGYRVKHVMNLTDVDDKTIAGALKEKKELSLYTDTYIRAFQDDLKTLNILSPNHPENQPRATAEIPAMLDLIKTLIEEKAAYESEGSVYFRIAAFEKYGKLSKKKLDKNIQGARVDVDEYDKEEGSDFVLWKKSKEGEPAWDSPWGKGRPGWHIECSAMSMKYLDETFDLHAGGEDLVFPHHENEIAQSEAATGKPFVRYWLHCKFLLVNGEKMSKSKGNFYTLRDLLKKEIDPMAIRYVLLATHYRMQLNFTLDALADGMEVLKRLDDCYAQCLSHDAISLQAYGDEALDGDPALTAFLEKTYSAMLEALGDDLNISVALAHFFSGVKEINKTLAENVKEFRNSMKSAREYFHRADLLFGLDVTVDRNIPDDIIQKLEERHHVRKEEAFKTDKKLQALSDKLRDEIQSLGWAIKDARPGQHSTVKRKRRAWDG